MWVPWRAGNPGQQRARRGVMTGAQAAAKARSKHRKVLFAKLKAGKLTPAQYEKQLRKLGG